MPPLRASLLLGLAACSFNGGGVGADDVADPDAAAGDDTPDAAAIDAAPTIDAAPPIDGPPADPAGTLHAEDAIGAVTLDGNGAEFAAAGAATIAWDIQNGQRYLTTHASYSASARLELQAIHDASNLYFFARVIDPTLATDSGADVWNDDGVTIYLDVVNDALGPYAADDHELVIRADGVWADYGPIGTPATVTGVAAAQINGYTIELAIAKSSLSAPVGTTMGFDALITDDDGWGDSNLDAYSVWFISPRPPCAACCTAEGIAQPWCDTTTFGTLVLD